jgi:type IV secretory pathway VirD2 relaxase
MGLAMRVDPAVWQIRDGAEATLREMGERGDIVRSMHRALASNGLEGRRDTSQLALHRQTLRERLVGRVLDKQLATDELGERVQLVIDATDGRVHQIEVSIAVTEEVTPGMIVAADRAARRRSEHRGGEG